MLSLIEHWNFLEILHGAIPYKNVPEVHGHLRTLIVLVVSLCEILLRFSVLVPNVYKSNK